MKRSRSLRVALIVVLIVTLGTLFYHFPALSQRMKAPGSSINTFTTYSGTINGVAVEGDGVGMLDLSTLESDNYITFTSYPSDFSPLYGKSHKCVHHKLLVPEIANVSYYDYDCTLTYSGDASGSIHTAARIYHNGNQSTSDATWNGTYSGPTSVPVDREFWEVLSPIPDPSVIQETGRRVMETGDNLVVVCTWTSTIYTSEPANLTRAVRLDYTWTSKSWDPNTGIFTKHVVVTKSNP